MATWAVGDVQGCRASLEALLARIGFDPQRDRLWCVGDLVNRGPDSVGVLRLLVELGRAVTVVLGNHDLHLLAASAGLRKPRASDTFGDVLVAHDRQGLTDWLAGWPLAHAELVAGKPWLMVHAGLHPSWDTARTLALAGEVEAAMQAEDRRGALTALCGTAPESWSDDLTGAGRLAGIVSVLTRLRACDPAGVSCNSFTGPPEDVPAGNLPWWAVPNRARDDHTVVCGHWAAQGLRREPGMVALDSACVWGGRLTALRLEDGDVVSVPCLDQPSRRD